jgi:hypothetical protein
MGDCAMRTQKPLTAKARQRMRQQIPPASAALGVGMTKSKKCLTPEILQNTPKTRALNRKGRGGKAAGDAKEKRGTFR